jgi:LCP family protein required for cell wall assembly
VLATAAVVVVVVAVAAFVVPEVFRRSSPPPVADHSAQRQVTPVDVLVVGLDDADHTDTIVLTRVHADGSVSLVSIPRDTWNGQTKLNRILATGGMPPLVDAVADLTGVRADHYAMVDMPALGAVADAVGGVPVCLRAATDDPFSGAHFAGGEQVLEGGAALAFVRQRHGLPNGDLDRIARQQAFLRGLATKLPDADLAALAGAVEGRIVTDDLDVVGFVQTLAAATSLHVGTIPAGEAGVETPQGAGIAVDPVRVKEFVADVQGTPPVDGVPCVN